MYIFSFEIVYLRIRREVIEEVTIEVISIYEIVLL